MSKKGNTKIILASVLGAVLIGIVVTTIVLVTKKSKKTEGGTSDTGSKKGNTTTTDESKPPPPPDNTTTTLTATFKSKSLPGFLAVHDATGTVYGNSDSPTTFTLIQGNSNGLYKIMDAQGRYMSEDGGTNGVTTMVTTTAPPEWALEQAGTDTVHLKSANSRYLSVQPDSSVQTNRRVADAWEDFRMIASATL